MPKKIVTDNKGCCMHKGLMGTKMLVLGLLIIANAYWMVMSWAYFIALIVIIAGLSKMIMPHYHE
ncbi:MAG: hypothetical protein Q7S33_01010 [Nanoarchaeota archaeon]|nr:hypothetical protein [Nanoarchaeota archaeon]